MHIGKAEPQIAKGVACQNNVCACCKRRKCDYSSVILVEGCTAPGLLQDDIRDSHYW